jgi:ParB-like chromosome segregation protein Spo0J
MTTTQLTLDTGEQEQLAIATSRATLPIGDILIDERIYPRKEVDPKRVALFADNMRDGVTYPIIEVEAHPDEADKYRVLDGAHRLGAYKAIGAEAIEVIIVNLNGHNPLLYAAQKALGPKNLGEKEIEEIACKVYSSDPTISLVKLARAIGIDRHRVKGYIAHLMAAYETARDVKVLRMHLLGVTRERLSYRIGIPRQTLESYLPKTADLPFSANENGAESSRIAQMIEAVRADIKRGYPAPNVADKHGWPEPLVWAVALQDKTDHERFEALKWGLRTWDHWGFPDADRRFGDDWPGRIPAQLVAHTLYYFTSQGDLIFDPMAGGGVVPDVCLAFNRRCWAFDSNDRPDTRPEIEPHTWDLTHLAWPVNGKSLPDLIFFDPPYFDKKDSDYQEKAEGSISSLDRSAYLQFFADFFTLAREHTKATSRIAFLNADWRDFQGKPARDEDPTQAITILDYARIADHAGWEITHLIDCPLSTERMNAGVVSAMQARRTLGIVRRTLLIARKRK